MMETCRAAAAEGLPIFLFGGRVDTLDKLSGRLLEQIPNLQIAGRRASRFRQLTPDEWDELVKEVRDSGARVLLVGLGCPRQEVFVFEVRDAVSIPTLAVGAAFNLVAAVFKKKRHDVERSYVVIDYQNMFIFSHEIPL